MNQKGLKEFMEVLKLDNELAKQIEAAGTDASKIIMIGKENGYEFDVEDLQRLHEEILSSNAEFSDEDLEKVAGGIVTLIACAVVGAASAAVGAATAVAGNLKDLKSDQIAPN